MLRTDPSFDDPQIDVLSASPRREMLQLRLRQFGWRPLNAGLPLDQVGPRPLLVDMATVADQPALAAFFADQAMARSTRQVVILGNATDLPDGIEVLHLREVDQLQTLKARLAIRQRERLRNRELDLRQVTQSKLQGLSPVPPQIRNLRVLYLGSGASRFQPLKRALQLRGIDVVAALTHHTAQDYLTTSRFDAVIVHPQSIDDEAARFLARFAPGETNAPAPLILIDEPALCPLLPGHLADKVAIIAEAATSPERLAARIGDYLSSRRVPDGPIHRLSSKTHDAATRLYSRQFLELHLAAQFAASTSSGEPLTLLALTTGGGARELRTIAGAIATHLRDTDLAAALDPRHVAIVLPSTPYRGAVQLARRLEQAIEAPFDWRAVERRAFHSVASLLGALAIRPGSHQVRRA